MTTLQKLKTELIETISLIGDSDRFSILETIVESRPRIRIAVTAVIFALNLIQSSVYRFRESFNDGSE